MSDSLQEQLVALGLAKKEQAEARKSRSADGGKARAAAKPAKKKRAKKAQGEQGDLERAYRLKAKLEREEGERTRREKIAMDARNKAINDQLRALVAEHAVNERDAEQVRNFLDRGRIRMVRVTEEQDAAINDGTIGICYVAGRYFLLPAEQMTTVREISPAHAVDTSGGDEAPGASD
ncbi:MAG: DUF2058 family protein [Xanthomonadales bacterium]|nr:DUF2058 family protein [Xanthomonadales bacterium]